MATELKDIIGRVETLTEVGDVFETSYEEQRLSLTRFSGGENGIMVQLTMPANDGPFAYIQLTKDQVKELIVELTKEIL
jgi:hypothetical protein